MGARSKCEINGGTRRRAVANQSFEPQIVCGRFAGRPDHVHNVIFHTIIDVDVVNDVACSNDLLRLNHSVHAQIRRRSRHQIKDASFLALLRVADVQLEHETIELCFRQLVRAFLFNWVLGSKDQERIGQGICLLPDCDLPFLHRF